MKASEHAGLLRKPEMTKRTAAARGFEAEMQAELAKILPHFYGKKEKDI